MKVYVAARYGRRQEMVGVHIRLRAVGHEPTSRWVEGAEEGQSQEQSALMDVADVRRAQALLLFTDEVAHSSVGGGRFFEASLAHGEGIPVYTVGPAQIVFNHLPALARLRFDSLGDALQALGTP